MDLVAQLNQYGFFDARVPRYTSYPPANRFMNAVGQDNQKNWLQSVPNGSVTSLYLHIPFCRRLCWFCACRTQGTQSLRPVESYIQTLIQEIDRVADTLPPDVRVDRVHIGGGTPTLLSPALMDQLLLRLFARFETTTDCDFSVEVDPTDCAEELVSVLADYGMSRASIGVQDFDPKVQRAIGRQQSVLQTEQSIEWLRSAGIHSLNIDLLYGLPFQTAESFERTLRQTMEMKPDRIALFGYAHVPKMSKRQVLIAEHTLPSGQERYALSLDAQRVFTMHGLKSIGIDHFARPADTLALAAQNGTLRRNFQGYTDDTSPYLIGLGASSISKVPQGYIQNAVATGAYQERIQSGSLAGQKGYAFEGHDPFFSDLIEQLMCRFEIDMGALLAAFPNAEDELAWVRVQIRQKFPDVFAASGDKLTMKRGLEPLVRIICAALDPAHAREFGSHSMAS
ncbi:MAG: oxygen-independent coproporphyrinogen III oxidase [Pseudomonadota bacterium]